MNNFIDLQITFILHFLRLNFKKYSRKIFLQRKLQITKMNKDEKYIFDRIL